MDKEILAGLISFVIANLICSWLGMHLFINLSQLKKPVKGMTKFLIFLSYFIGWCIIAIIIINNSELGVIK